MEGNYEREKQNGYGCEPKEGGGFCVHGLGQDNICCGGLVQAIFGMWDDVVLWWGWGGVMICRRM